MSTSKICFYKYRYWLLNTHATGELSEKDKNHLFCEKFFKSQDVTIGNTIYKIRQLFNEGVHYFGQIGKVTKAHLNEDTGAQIEPVEADDNPFLYYYSIAEDGYQVIYVQRDNRNILGTTCDTIERKLSQIADNAAKPLLVSISCIVEESCFWDSIRYFNIIDKVEFTFTRPNFLTCEEDLSDALLKLKASINSDTLSVGYKGHDGLIIDENNEEIKAQAAYSSEYSGDWKIKGRQSEQSKQETRTKTSAFKAVLVELPKKLRNIEDMFIAIKKQINEKKSD